MKATTTIHLPKNARVFIMEDSAERIRWFKEKLGEHIVGLYDSPEPAKQALYHLEPFSLDAIFLDHDLGYDPRRCWTSIPVAIWLSQHTSCDPAYGRRVVIHSYNPTGAKRLQSLLPGSAILPYGSFDIQVES